MNYVESRFARDFIEVPQWLTGGLPPSTVQDATFRADRLGTMRMRLSAAYKGVNALLMRAGARDFRSGQHFDHAIFFGENVDIHHIFPKAWCQDQGIKASVYDSIINKTPLSYQTNRTIGGVAPSEYIAKLEKGTSKNPSMLASKIDELISSHLIDAQLLRKNDFLKFMDDRRSKLLALIQEATGKAAYLEKTLSDDDGEIDAVTEVASLTMKAA